MTTAQSVDLEAPRFEDGKPLLIAGFSERYSGPDESQQRIPAQWDRLAPYFGTLTGAMGMIGYGVCFDTSSPDRFEFEYIAGIEVSDFTGVPAEFRQVRLPARRYAVFAHRGHVSTMKQTLDAIHHQWVPTSGYEYAGGPDRLNFFERYGDEFDPVAGMGDVEVWVPIKA